MGQVYYMSTRVKAEITLASCKGMIFLLIAKGSKVVNNTSIITSASNQSSELGLISASLPVPRMFHIA